MEDFVLRASFGDDREVWISDVSRDTFEANEIDDLGTDFGYFVMTGDRNPGGRGARILAKAASAQAALELFGMLTSRTKRCAILLDEPQQYAAASVARFPTKDEASRTGGNGMAPKSKVRRQPKVSASAAIFPSKIAKRDGKVRASKPTSPTSHCQGADGLPSTRRAKRKNASGGRSPRGVGR